jgi:hypothetical protein
MPCGYHLPVCKCCDHLPGHTPGIPGCKHSGQPGYHVRVRLPKQEGSVACDGSVVLDRKVYSGWPMTRLFKNYSKAYPHCDVEVTRLP